MFNKIAIFFLFLTLSGSSFAYRWPTSHRSYSYDKNSIMIALGLVFGTIIVLFVIGAIIDIYSASKKEKKEDEKDDNNET